MSAFLPVCEEIQDAYVSKLLGADSIARHPRPEKDNESNFEHDELWEIHF